MAARARHRGAGGILLFVGLLAVTTYAAKPETVLAFDEAQAPVESSPTLQCLGHSLPLLAPAVTGVAVTCTVAGTAPDETAFRLSATLDSRRGGEESEEFLGPFCADVLQDGRGQCSGILTQQVSLPPGRVVMTGILLPTSRPLGPTTIVLEDRAQRPGAAALPPRPCWWGSYFVLRYCCSAPDSCPTVPRSLR
jgi:hypothetical protein